MDANYWIRQPVQQSSSAPVLKRQRSESDAIAGAPPAQETQNFQPRDEHTKIQALKDTRTLGASYDRYLQNSQQFPSYGSVPAGNGVTRSVGDVHGFRGGNVNISYQDPVLLANSGFRSLGPQDMVAANSSLSMGFRNQAPGNSIIMPMISEREMPLPPDASSTLFVEGLPRDTTEREIAHIFRPFRGYKEIRLVKKEPKYDGGSSVILCFVDFTSPACAMTAMNAVEGYKMDLHDPDSWALRLQFAKFPARRPSQNFHGRREMRER